MKPRKVLRCMFFFLFWELTFQETWQNPKGGCVPIEVTKEALRLCNSCIVESMSIKQKMCRVNELTV